MRRLFLAPPLPSLGERAVLAERERHHAAVMRLAPGTPLVLLDGAGAQVEATLLQDGAVVATAPPRQARPAQRLHVLLSLTKAAAMDSAVRMVTEAGATHIHPVLTRRSVAKGDKVDRWERIALAAAKQCGRADVPAVTGLLPLWDALELLPQDTARWIALPGSDAAEQAAGPAAVLIGPEGGFEEGELALTLERGFTPMGIGAWVFRADTAAAVAVAMLAPR
ncbi:MAG: RsmE family RNA methyltransferase [Deltaproteobacteria bacterium]|nr:RsmE family RNA methyltransferase [Deltaproteobacteria bacterium]